MGGGGGGGAGSAGTSIQNYNGGIGGNGKIWIDNYYYAGGGGGGAASSGGVSSSSGNGGDGSACTGSGGGGGSRTGNAGVGGSGVVAFSFDTSSLLSTESVELISTYSYQYYRFICTSPASGTVLFKSINFTATPNTFALSSAINNGDKINMNAYYGATYGNSVVSNTITI